MGWHWLIRLYRFQVYSSMIHHLYIVLCVYHPKLNLLYHHIFYLTPFTLYDPPTPIPSGKDHTVVCVYEFLSVWFFCSFICCFQFYIPHMTEIIWFLIFSDWFKRKSFPMKHITTANPLILNLGIHTCTHSLTHIFWNIKSKLRYESNYPLENSIFHCTM